MNREREQKLIDIMFEVAQASYLMGCTHEQRVEYYRDLRDEHMKAVVESLEVAGFPTVQMGMSWGVLR
jgi:hypothetical protein